MVLTINGVKIGIESQGDPEKKSRLPQSLKEFVDNGCSIIVCARRTRERTFNTVEDLRTKGYEILPIVMLKTPDPSSSNQKAAKGIVSEIEGLL